MEPGRHFCSLVSSFPGSLSSQYRLLTSEAGFVCYYQRREIGSQRKHHAAFRIVARSSDKPLDSPCVGIV